MGRIAGFVNAGGNDMASGPLQAIARLTDMATPSGVLMFQSELAGLLCDPLFTANRFTDCRTLPASNQTECVITLDGRLDNRAACISRLTGLNIEANSDRSDSEIILALYARHGDSMLDHLVGDYAFAIWNPERKRLFMARSPLGMRTLFWTCNGGRFGFASEPGLLINGLGLSREINEGAIGEALAMRFVSQTETFWRDIQRLPSGSAMSLESGQVRTWHWHNEEFEDFGSQSEGEHIEQFNFLFDQAVTSAMQGTSPVGIHVSGGLDSSSVACRAHALTQSGKLDSDFRLITARFPGEAHDETDWSNIVERHLGRDAIAVGYRGWDADEARQWAADTMMLPVRPNALATYIASCERLKAEGIGVLLTGEGGDDWMAGSLAHWPDLLGKWQLSRLLQETRGIAAGGNATLAFRALLGSAVGPLISSTRNESLIHALVPPMHEIPSWISPDWARKIGLAERLSATSLPRDLPTFAQQQRYGRYVHANSHIVFDNIFAMAARHDVELRHPFHDLRLTRFLMGAAGGMLLRNGEKKYLLRQAMIDTLPEAIRTRQDKAEFSAPVIEAVASYFAIKRPEDMIAAKLGWIDPRGLTDQVDILVAWRNKRDGSLRPITTPTANALWMMVSIDLWLENAVRV